MKTFDEERDARIAANGENGELQNRGLEFMRASLNPRYSYNFTWLGRPIIQYPQDMIAVQEIVWSVQPDLIVETGIAHGGSLIFSAALLELNAACGGPADGHVLGVDIDVRPHNRSAIEAHPMAKRISMIQGSSIAPDVVAQVRAMAAKKKRILVCLDSNHSHAHVLAELEAYAPLTSVGSYCIVFDTIVEDTAECVPSDRPWGKGDNPKTAVHAYVKAHPEFEIDRSIDHKLLISVAPEGYLKRTR